MSMRVSFQLPVFVLAAAATATVLAWVQPCVLGGWGWFGPALVGPFAMVIAVTGMIFPDNPDPLTFAGMQPGSQRPESVWEKVLISGAVAAGAIDGGLWLYFNWR